MFAKEGETTARYFYGTESALSICHAAAQVVQRSAGRGWKISEPSPAFKRVHACM
jgi:hypothetical protein